MVVGEGIFQGVKFPWMLRLNFHGKRISSCQKEVKTSCNVNVCECLFCGSLSSHKTT